MLRKGVAIAIISFANLSSSALAQNTLPPYSPPEPPGMLAQLKAYVRSYTQKSSNQPTPPSHKKVEVRPLNVHPDCSEVPLKFSQLEDLANSTRVNTMQDFLNSIPKGTLQTFTFVYNSKSLQKGHGDGAVSPLWPRVLRSSIDGKTTISYVCDPRNDQYGKVEILHFDDKTNEFKTTEMNFTQSKLKPVHSHSGRVQNNPDSCVSCHAKNTINGKHVIRPIWPEYFDWGDCDPKRGISIYGSSDDGMDPNEFRDLKPEDYRYKSPGCNPERRFQAHRQEVQDYRNFRKLQKDNPCYSSLPWPDAKESDALAARGTTYESYPFISKGTGVSRRTAVARPNMRMTTVYAMLQAKQITHILKKNPAYDFLKYYLVMNELNCLLPQDYKAIEKMGFDLSGAVRNQSLSNMAMNEANYETSPFEASLLHEFASRSGLKSEDWSLQFGGKVRKFYDTGTADSSGAADLTIPGMVARQIFEDITAKNPAVQVIPNDRLVFDSDFSDQYGRGYECMKNFGAQLESQYDGPASPLCKSLHAANAAQQAKMKSCVSCSIPKFFAAPHVLSHQVSPIVQAFMKAVPGSPRRGQKLIGLQGKGKCVSCHSEGQFTGLPSDFSFIPDENASPSDFKKSLNLLRVKAKSGFLESLRLRLVVNKTMPPDEDQKPPGKRLTDQDRLDIMSYLQSLAH